MPPAFLIDKALAQMTLSVKSAREGGAVVESIERRTKNIPGNWAERARAIAAKEIAPALERQLAELQAQRAVATNDAGISARPHGEEFYRWALKASTTTEPVARRGPRDGPRASCSACTRRWTRS